jgi:predicted AlkP superfamily pyrophosphatase or phosphodiesterase
VTQSCGPNSSNVTEQIKYIDQHMGYLIQKLKKAKLFEKVNMIVTSDHGFTELKPAPSVIDLNLHLPSKLYDADVGSPIVGLWPKDRGNQSSIDLIYNTLKDVKGGETILFV